MRDYEEIMPRECRRIILGAVALLPALAIAAADSETQADEQRIRRTIVHRELVIEQVQLPDKPEITVIINYKEGATKPMPVMLGWYGPRDRKIAELTRRLPATQHVTITEDLPPMQPLMAELVDRGCAVVSFQNCKPEPRPWPKGRAKWV